MIAICDIVNHHIWLEGILKSEMVERDWEQDAQSEGSMDFPAAAESRNSLNSNSSSESPCTITTCASSEKVSSDEDLATKVSAEESPSQDPPSILTQHTPKLGSRTKEETCKIEIPSDKDIG